MILWLVSKIIGVVMIVIGGFMVVFGPGVIEHQEAGKGGTYSSFGIGGVVLGIILLVVGGFILFSP